MGRCFTLTCAAWQALTGEISICWKAHLRMMWGFGPHQHLPNLRRSWQIFLKHNGCLGRVVIVEAILVSHARSHLLPSGRHAVQD